jgi:hypothetical protein
MLNLNRNGKASIALLVAGLTLSQASLAPRQSHAIIAIASGGTAIPALIVLGAGVGGVGIGLALATGPFTGLIVVPSYVGVNAQTGIGVGLSAAGLLALLAGLVMLDESGVPTPNFQSLTLAKAQEAGISSQEMRAFNRQLDRTNSVSESIARGIAQGKIADANVAVQYAHGEWVEAHERGLISADAYTALNKLSAHAVQKAQAQVSK